MNADLVVISPSTKMPHCQGGPFPSGAFSRPGRRAKSLLSLPLHGNSAVDEPGEPLRIVHLRGDQAAPRSLRSHGVTAIAMKLPSRAEFVRTKAHDRSSGDRKAVPGKRPCRYTKFRARRVGGRGLVSHSRKLANSGQVITGDMNFFRMAPNAIWEM